MTPVWRARWRVIVAIGWAVVLGLLWHSVPLDAAGSLVASAARTVSGVSTGIAFPEPTTTAQFVLRVTAAGTLVGDTLDVYLQTSYDGGTSWDDFAHVTQVLGNGGAKAFIVDWARDVTPTTPLKAVQDAAMAAGVNQGPVGSLIRAKWVIVNGGGTHSFTFDLLMDPHRR